MSVYSRKRQPARKPLLAACPTNSTTTGHRRGTCQSASRPFSGGSSDQNWRQNAAYGRPTATAGGQLPTQRPSAPVIWPRIWPNHILGQEVPFSLSLFICFTLRVMLKLGVGVLREYFALSFCYLFASFYYLFTLLHQNFFFTHSYTHISFCSHIPFCTYAHTHRFHSHRFFVFA